MRKEITVGCFAVLIVAVYFITAHKNVRNYPADLRDAVNSEGGAFEQLQHTAPVEFKEAAAVLVPEIVKPHQKASAILSDPKTVIFMHL